MITILVCVLHHVCIASWVCTASCDSFLMPTQGQIMHFSENVKLQYKIQWEVLVQIKSRFLNVYHSWVCTASCTARLLPLESFLLHLKLAPCLLIPLSSPSTIQSVFTSHLWTVEICQIVFLQDIFHGWHLLR